MRSLFSWTVARRTLTLVLPATLALSFACGADSGAPLDVAADGSTAEGPRQDGAIVNPDGASISQDGGNERGDSATDAASDPLAPHPPLGSKRCGHGTIKQSEAEQACLDPSLDPSAPLPPLKRNCSGALTTNGGTWEVWCSANETYFYAKLDGLKSTGTLTAGCPQGFPTDVQLEPPYVNARTASTAAAGGATLVTNPKGNMFSTTKSVDISMDTKWSTGWSKGTGNFLLKVNDSTWPQCNLPSTLVLAIDVAWDTNGDAG